MNKIRLIALATVVVFMSACGGGSSSGSNESVDNSSDSSLSSSSDNSINDGSSSSSSSSELANNDDWLIDLTKRKELNGYSIVDDMNWVITQEPEDISIYSKANGYTIEQYAPYRFYYNKHFAGFHRINGQIKDQSCYFHIVGVNLKDGSNKNLTIGINEKYATDKNDILYSEDGSLYTISIIPMIERKFEMNMYNGGYSTMLFGGGYENNEGNYIDFIVTCDN